ncbi:hypothetical protein ACLOJK_021569 [Asimina triloba]
MAHPDSSAGAHPSHGLSLISSKKRSGGVQNIPKISAFFLSSQVLYLPSTPLYHPPFLLPSASPPLHACGLPRFLSLPLAPSLAVAVFNRPNILLSLTLSFALLPMKHLIRRLARVYDSSQYVLLRSDSPSPASKPRRSKSKTLSASAAATAHVPQGHLPVYVGDEMERFVVRADFLKHPIFLQLLDRSAEEYGYEQQGVLRIPCRVLLFKKFLDVLTDGDQIDDVDELFRSFSEDLL